MKEDYLWDKTGADPEIEKLENALLAFRYQENDPPALPAKIIPFEKKSPRRFFQFAFASAACAALVLVSFGVWLQFSINKTEVANNSVKSVSPQKDFELPKEKLSEKPESEDIKETSDLSQTKIDNSKQTAKKNVVKVSKFVPVKTQKNNIIERKTKAKTPDLELTEEEKYAYNQLMLALSITGSKLKIVKDKVEGIEEQTAVLEK